jgi:hypothetical protein
MKIEIRIFAGTKEDDVSVETEFIPREYDEMLVDGVRYYVHHVCYQFIEKVHKHIIVYCYKEKPCKE